MSKITIFIPPLPRKDYSYRLGDAQIIHDDNKNAIVIDGGEDSLCNEIIKYCKSHGITHITYILSHWHYDHDRGMKLLLDSSIIVDKIYCPPPADLTKLRDSDAKDDYSRAMTRIAQANKLKKSIIYPPADQYTTIKVGTIVCKIWRRSVRPSENVDYQVNNTSLCCYFPDLYYATTGDSINAFDTFLQTKPGKITVFKIPHHGNACTTNPCALLKEAGAQICWYNHSEKYGVDVGGDSFSKWGAGYCKKHFICIRPFYTITMTACDKKLYIEQNGSKWSYDIPYDGKPATCGWLKGTKGMWYQYPDGTWATGWKWLPKQDGKGEAWHLFDNDGWLLYGWQKVNGYWYFLNEKDGHMLTGWLNRAGLFYLEPVSGKNQGHAYMSETAVIDGKTYTFDANCYAKLVSNDVKPIASGRPNIKQNPNFKGYNVSNRNDPIMYIVVHYTGAEGTAKNNIDYFNGGNRNASADYFINHDGEIWQYNPNIEKRYSWHCGGGRQSSTGGSFFGSCKNANSIGVELCTHKIDGAWTFTDKTVESARKLVKYLMETYNIKQKNVIRHWDVNGKYCPNVYGWLSNSTQWDKYKASLSASTYYDDAPQIYRVRKSWKAADTQIGAFAGLDNARKFVKLHPGYHIYDKNGNEVT